MANISLTKENIKYIRDAFSHFFPEDAIYSADEPYTSGEFNWDNRQSFIDFVYRLTGLQIKSEKDFEDIKKAELAVEALIKTGEEKPEANRPTKEQLETFEEEAKKRKESQQKAVAMAKKSVQEAIKKKEELAKGASQQEKWAKLQEQKLPKVAPKDVQEKILHELKDKVLYAVPEKKEPKIIFSDNEKKLLRIAQTDPPLFADKLSKLIIDRNPDIPPETLQPLSQIVAVDITWSLIDPTTIVVPTGVFSSISKIGVQIPSLSSVAKEEVAKTSALLTVFSENQENLYRTLLARSVGENITNKVLGFPETVYTLSETPGEGSFTLKLDQVQTNSFSLQESPVFEALNNPSFDFAKSEVKSQLSGFASSALNSLPKEGFLSNVSRFFSSKSFDSIAPFIGLPTQATYIGTSFFGKAITIFLPKYAPAIANLSAKLGVDVGIKAAAPIVAQAVTKAGSAITGTVTGAIAKTGLSATLNTVLQSLGSAAPIIGNIIALAVGWLLGKIAEKINWKKVKEWSAAILGGIAGLVTLPFVGLGAALGVGLGTTAVSVAFGGGLGGLTLSGIGSGIAGFFGALGGAFLSAIGMPILVTLLVFPVVVALILFIINSSAYVVPQKTAPFGGEQIICSKDKGKIPFPNTASDGIASRAWQISADLYQGFWCFWNRSPKAPPPYNIDFPNDTIEYPPSYPELFDYPLFKSNPNPPDNGSENLFWCTWLIVKSFSENGNNSVTASNALWVPTLLQNFKDRGKFVDGSVAKPGNFPPGSVIFFDVTGGGSPAGHVGIVYSINIDGLYFVQSNAPTKSGFITFNANGIGISKTPEGWFVVGIGLP